MCVYLYYLTNIQYIMLFIYMETQTDCRWELTKAQDTSARMQVQRHKKAIKLGRQLHAGFSAPTLFPCPAEVIVALPAVHDLSDKASHQSLLQAFSELGSSLDWGPI